MRTATHVMSRILYGVRAARVEEVRFYYSYGLAGDCLGQEGQSSQSDPPWLET